MTRIAALALALIGLASSLPAPESLDLVLLIDVSSSVIHPGLFKTDRTLVDEAAEALAHALDPGDRVRLGTFGTTIAIASSPAAGPAAIEHAAGDLAGSIGGPSPVWDALDAAATALEHDAGRRAIIVITDGRGTGNRLGFGEVSARLEQAGIPIVVVALDLQRSPQPDPYARLRHLASNTGGACILVKRDDLESGISRAVAALRTQ